MANRLITWAKNQRVGDAEAKAVLIDLADISRSDGLCWASQRTLSEDTEIPRRTLQRKLSLLVEGGWVATEQRTRENGGRTSNLYRLLAPAEFLRPSDDLANAPCATLAQGGAHSDGAAPAPGVAQHKTLYSTPEDTDVSSARLRDTESPGEALRAGEREDGTGGANETDALHGVLVDGLAQDLVALARLFRQARLEDLAIKYVEHAEFNRQSRVLTTRFDIGAQTISRDSRARQLLANQAIDLRGPRWVPRQPAQIDAA